MTPTKFAPNPNFAPLARLDTPSAQISRKPFPLGSGFRVLPWRTFQYRVLVVLTIHGAVNRQII